KVVGDLAQFMVQNDLDEAAVLEQADTLNFPRSVVEFFQGYLGVPYGGFPEPMRTKVVRDLPTITGRPGATLEPLDFEQLRKDLREKHGPGLRDVDLLSAALYPKVFEEFMAFREEYADVSVLPTRNFLTKMAIGEEISVEIERGKVLIIRLRALGELDEDGCRVVYFELNGRPRSLRIPDKSVKDKQVVRERVDPSDLGAVGAPMPGVVLEVRAEKGAEVKAGDALVVLSAMKMETVVAAPLTGKVEKVAVLKGDQVSGGDLLIRIKPAERPA